MNRPGEITDIGMGPTTMVCGVKPPALLDKAAAGDKAGFGVEEIKGDGAVTIVETARRAWTRPCHH